MIGKVEGPCEAGGLIFVDLVHRKAESLKRFDHRGRRWSPARPRGPTAELRNDGGQPVRETGQPFDPLDEYRAVGLKTAYPALPVPGSTPRTRPASARRGREHGDDRDTAQMRIDVFGRISGQNKRPWFAEHLLHLGRCRERLSVCTLSARNGGMCRCKATAETPRCSSLIAMSCARSTSAGDIP